MLGKKPRRLTLHKFSIHHSDNNTIRHEIGHVPLEAIDRAQYLQLSLLISQIVLFVVNFNDKIDLHLES